MFLNLFYKSEQEEKVGKKKEVILSARLKSEDRVDKFTTIINELEKQVSEHKEQSEILRQRYFDGSCV